jgi:hypothetical protein
MSERAARSPALAWLAAATFGALALTAEAAFRTPWLKPSAERSPFSWAAAVTILFGAGCAAVLARRNRRWQRVLLATVLVWIGLDEAFGLHERFAADLDARRVGLGWSGVALAVVALLYGAAALLLALEARLGRESMLVAGVGLLAVSLTGRLGGGALAALHHLPGGDPRDVGEATTGGMALSGWVLVAAALLARVRARAPIRR